MEAEEAGAAISIASAAGSNATPTKKKRNLPGNPDPEAEVIALSPTTLMATNRFLCEICGKGFQRDQNLQLHRRGHNLPWKLKQRTGRESRKRVYVCPEKACIHNQPSRALGDLTGIKKHFCRKHGEKKWKCDKCSKHYAVKSDWKAHDKTCGTRDYRCDCGTIFSRRDSFVTHRAFCDALAEESARVDVPIVNNSHYFPMQHVPFIFNTNPSSNTDQMEQMQTQIGIPGNYHFSWGFGNQEGFTNNPLPLKEVTVPSLYSSDRHRQQISVVPTSTTALLQTAAGSDPTFVGSFEMKDGKGNGMSVQGENRVVCGLYTGHSTSDRPVLCTNERRRVRNEEIDAEETTDFLGVGIQDICRTSSGD